MLKMIDEGAISGKIGKKILPEMVKTDSSPRDIARRHGLVRISEHEVLDKLIESVFREFPDAVRDAQTDAKAVHYLVGQLMKKTEGRADPQLANKLIRERLRSHAQQVD
jgi:aspartyl-tRNA(Asn)/glutamyl-tRNA(Gln) amidotransferase subunit B